METKLNLSPGLPCIDYYYCCLAAHEEYGSEATRSRLEKHKADCQANMFRVGDVWRSRGYAQWTVLDVTAEGEALFSQVKNPNRTCKIKWDSLSLRDWRILFREGEE